MHEMRIVAIDDPVAWASVSLSGTPSDGATSMRPLLMTAVTCYIVVRKYGN